MLQMVGRTNAPNRRLGVVHECGYFLRSIGQIAWGRIAGPA